MEPFTYYLSGPMTGYPEHNFPLFRDVTKRLRADGLRVISPHEVNEEGAPELPYEEYIKRDIKVMLECNSIIMLPGWYRSKGARIEFDLAMDLNFFIYRLEGYDTNLRLFGIDEGFYDV
jgi:hypothetical protein